MAEALVSAILKQLTGFMSDNVQQELRLLTGVEKEAKKLADNLQAIQALLRDVEEQQMKSESIRLWLERLKEAAYDMEDELDEWNTRLLKYSHSASSLKRKVLSLIPCFPFVQVISRRRMAVRIKEINEELDEIDRAQERYQLAPIGTRQPASTQTVSYVDVSTLFGRDQDKENLKTVLLSDETSEAGDVIQPTVQTISVVGMGGIGKTTLAQLVHNDDDIQAHFDQRIWVCVSNAFSQTKVARDIILSLEKQDTNPKFLLESIPLQSCPEAIHQKIEGKKFLLVLDDVWTEHGEDWEPILATLKYGVAGSRILVTTRKESVAKKMNSSCLSTSKVV